MAFDWGGTLDVPGAARATGNTRPVSSTAKTVIEQVARLDLVLLLASNTTPAQNRRPMLARAGLEGLFTYVIQSHEVGVAKPEPEFFRIVHMQAGCAPHEILFVGDHADHDIRPALAYGMGAVLVAPFPPADLPAGACHIQDLAVLPRLLREDLHA